jgi:hypothetical protein
MPQSVLAGRGAEARPTIASPTPGKLEDFSGLRASQESDTNQLAPSHFAPSVWQSALFSQDWQPLVVADDLLTNPDFAPPLGGRSSTGGGGQSAGDADESNRGLPQGGSESAGGGGASSAFSDSSPMFSGPVGSNDSFASTLRPPVLSSQASTHITSASSSSNTPSPGVPPSGPTGAPVANDDSYSLVHDQPLTINATGVLANDTDPNNLPLTAVIVSTPSHGCDG